MIDEKIGKQKNGGVTIVYNIRSCKIYFDCECTRREAKSVRETASVGGPLPLPKTKIISAGKEIRNGQTNNVITFGVT